MKQERNTTFSGPWVVFRIKNGISEAIESHEHQQNAEKAAHILEEFDIKHNVRYSVEWVSNSDLNEIKNNTY